MSETTPGKNVALNAGLALVEGDLTVLTDDDVFPHADWLVQLRKAADTHPQFSFFGGAVVPRWEIPPPQWVRWLNLSPIFTITPAWMNEGELIPYEVTLVMGPNMLVRTSVFRAGARLDASIGPCGYNSYPMGSETELILRLSSQGHKAWHVRARSWNISSAKSNSREHGFCNEPSRTAAANFDSIQMRSCGVVYRDTYIATSPNKHSSLQQHG